MIEKSLGEDGLEVAVSASFSIPQDIAKLQIDSKGMLFCRPDVTHKVDDLMKLYVMANG